MVIVALGVSTLIAAFGIHAHRMSGRLTRRGATQAANSTAKRQRLLAARLAARKITHAPNILPRCPECGLAFTAVEHLWAHLDDHH